MSRPDIRTVLMSGYSGNDLDERVKAAATVPLLTKPFTYEELSRSIREALDVQRPAAD